jgi:succinate dehydrogenase/fumarate reductase flavoprotein subunit
MVGCVARGGRVSKDQDRSSRISRRAFLKAAGIGAGVAGTHSLVPLLASQAFAASGPDREIDVAVIGSGGAAWPAALYAKAAGADVEIFEKGAFAGGTTYKSGGVYWIPNNPVMRAKGMTDEKADALRYMARLAYPDLYSPARAHLGLEPNQYSLIETFYERGSGVIEQLHAWGALDSTFWPGIDGPFPDYHLELPENKAPYGRSIVPKRSDGSAGDGSDLIRMLHKATEERGIAVHMRHAARNLILSESGAVVGVELQTRSGVQRVRARKGVIFSTGGFAHNPELVKNFLRGVIYGSCEVPTNEGDFVAMATAAGARLANMKNAAWKQVLLEQTLEFGSIPNGVAVVPGDSAILVNRNGKRVVNEKLNYNQRAQVHFDWDAAEYLYANQFLFMLYDARTAERFAGMEPIPAKGVVHPAIIRVDTLAEVGPAIDRRLASLEPRVARFRLSERFGPTLAESVARYNAFAKQGVDADFHRGETVHEGIFHGPAQPGNDLPNSMMYPLSDQGPYYIAILAAGSYGTRGGPEINPSAQVLHASGQPIEGLYGAGNCIASPAGGGYWGGGAQIGPALVYGAIAGEHAAGRGEG